MNKISDVFIRPKFDRYISNQKRLQIIEDIKEIAKSVPVSISITACRDPKDNKFLELAIKSKSPAL